MVGAGLGQYNESGLAAQSAIAESEFISAYFFDGADLVMMVCH